MNIKFTHYKKIFLCTVTFVYVTFVSFAQENTPSVTNNVAGKIEAGASWISSDGFNADNALNMRNILYRGQLKLNTKVNLTDSLSLNSLLAFYTNGLEYAVPTSDDFKQNYGTIALGFDQLFFDASLGDFSFTLGKAPLSHSTSFFLSPADYTRNLGTFFDETGQWFLGASWSKDFFKASLNYQPVFEFTHDKNSAQRSELENALSSFETSNKLSLLNIDLAIFIQPTSDTFTTDLHILGYIQEKSKYDWSNYFYSSGGLSFNTIINSYVTSYGEVLLGNGFIPNYYLEDSGLKAVPIPNTSGEPAPYKLTQNSMNDFSWRGLVALRYSPTGDTTIDLQYYYNALGYDTQQLAALKNSAQSWRTNYTATNPMAQGSQKLYWASLMESGLIFNSLQYSQHLLILDVRQNNIFNRLNLSLTAAISLLDASMYTRFVAHYQSSDSLAFELKNELSLGSADSLFVLNPRPWSVTFAVIFN